MKEILIAIIVILVLSNIFQAKSNKKAPPDKIKGMPYKDKYILTKNEYIFYNELKKLADENKWIICPKVGLKDLFEITTKENYMAYFRKISQKHIDFIICKDDLKPLYAIELDDNSHKKEKAKESDEFKNELFKNSKIKLIRIKTCKEYSKEYIIRNIENTETPLNQGVQGSNP